MSVGGGGQDAAGRTALHMAAAYGVGPIASLLIDKGADPDVQVTSPPPSSLSLSLLPPRSLSG